MQTMYPAQAFSPTTTLASSITATDTTIPVTDLSKLPPAPNLVTIGEGLEAETILYTGTDANAGALTGVTRGFQGTARSWEAGTPIARLLTAYDHDAFKSNIEEVSQRIATHEGAADPHPQYVAKSSLRNTFQDAAGVIDAPATANLVAITYDGLAGLMDGRYSAANASKLAGETAAQIKAGARTLSSAPLVVEVSSSAPESPVNGQIWYDSVNHKFRGYANGAWV